MSSAEGSKFVGLTVSMETFHLSCVLLAKAIVLASKRSLLSHFDSRTPSTSDHNLRGLLVYSASEASKRLWSSTHSMRTMSYGRCRVSTVVLQVHAVLATHAFFAQEYAGDFEGNGAVIAARNESYGPRDDGKEYINPNNIVPAQIYVGMKGKMEDGKFMLSLANTMKTSPSQGFRRYQDRTLPRETFSHATDCVTVWYTVSPSI